MNAGLRIGLYPYLNVQPIVWGLRGTPGMEVILDVPSRIAERFREGSLDVAMIPAFEAASIDAWVHDSLCIASDGAVETVILHHRVPIADVRTLALDEASRTSAALSRILVAGDSGRTPETSLIGPGEGALADTDAVLVIGDPAFTFERPGFAKLDLGAAWKERSGLPFVFAVLVMNQDAVGRGAPSLLEAAFRRGQASAPEIARSYNSGVDADRAERYLREVIRYEFGPKEKEGLRLFYRLATERGLLREAKELRFHAI